MIRAIIYTAIGFYLSRQFYERYDKVQQVKKEKEKRQRLRSFLKQKGIDGSTIKEAEAVIFKSNEQ